VIKKREPEEVEFLGTRYVITTEANQKASSDDWIQISEVEEDEERKITVRISTEHPYTNRFFGDKQIPAGLWFMATAFAVAERTAVSTGVEADLFRDYFNQILRTLAEDD